MNYLNEHGKVRIPPSPKAEDEIVAPWAGDVSSPVVSVICHVYNHERFITDALNGFLMQETSFPFEVLVHDDASKDKTGEIITDYQARFPRIVRVISQKENIYSQGRRPIEFTYPSARGTYIALCEGDDYWLDPNKLQRQYEQLKSSPGAILSFHSAVVIDESGHYLRTNNPQRMGFSRQDLKKSPFIPTLTRFFEKKAIPWLHDERLPVANDVALVSQLGQFGSAVYANDIVPSVYRQHGNGVWSLQTQTEKARISVEAFLFLAERYERVADFATSGYFQRRALLVLMRSVGVGGVLRAVGGVVFRKLLFWIKLGLVRSGVMSDCRR